VSTQHTDPHAQAIKSPPAPAAAPGGKAGAAPQTFPALMYQHIATPPGFKPVEVKDADALKAMKPRPFATATEAALASEPLEQPISHIERTGNTEQFDERKSQYGAPIPAGVIQTPAPVSNVFVKTGVDAATMHVTAVLPDGVEPGVLTATTNPGAQVQPVKVDDAKTRQP